MKKPVVIIGAGLAGGAAAWKLGEKAEVFESSDRVGGIARTYGYEGFSYDLGPHVFYFRNDKIIKWVERIIGSKWRRQIRKAKIAIDGEKVDYPIQEGFLQSEKLKARFLESLINASQIKEGRFSQMAVNLYGSSLAQGFFIPYNQKLWSHPLDEMDAECARRFLPVFPKEDLQLVANGKPPARGANAYFYYPTRGGIGVLAESLTKELKSNLHLSTKVLEINTKERWVETNDAKRHAYSALISTIPLPEVIRISVDLPRFAKKLAMELKSVGMVFVHLSLARSLSDDFHWMYFPDPDIGFHRISIPENYSEDMTPTGRGSLVAEISFQSDHKPDILTILEQVKRDVVKTGIVEGPTDILAHDVQVRSYAYVFPTEEGQKIREELLSILRQRYILLAGRYALWGYGNMERALEQGINATEKLC